MRTRGSVRMGWIAQMGPAWAAMPMRTLTSVRADARQRPHGLDCPNGTRLGCYAHADASQRPHGLDCPNGTRLGCYAHADAGQRPRGIEALMGHIKGVTSRGGILHSPLYK